MHVTEYIYKKCQYRYHTLYMYYANQLKPVLVMHAYTVYYFGGSCSVIIYYCHPLPSNSQHEPTNSMKNVTLVTRLLLTFHH